MSVFFGVGKWPASPLGHVLQTMHWNQLDSDSRPAAPAPKWCCRPLLANRSVPWIYGYAATSTIYIVDFSCTQQLVYINLFLWFLSLSWFNLVISFLWCLSNFIHIPCQELLARWASTAGTTSWPLAAGRRVDSGAPSAGMGWPGASRAEWFKSLWAGQPWLINNHKV